MVASCLLKRGEGFGKTERSKGTEALVLVTDSKANSRGTSA
jgi:hypothetical protein